MVNHRGRCCTPYAQAGMHTHAHMTLRNRSLRGPSGPGQLAARHSLVWGTQQITATQAYCKHTHNHTQSHTHTHTRATLMLRVSTVAAHVIMYTDCMSVFVGCLMCSPVTYRSQWWYGMVCMVQYGMDDEFLMFSYFLPLWNVPCDCNNDIPFTPSTHWGSDVTVNLECSPSL